MSDDANNVLVVGPSWVGDMVMAQSLFRALQDRESCRITVLAPEWTRPLTALMPEVAAAISLPFSHGELRVRERRKLGRELIGRRFQRAIVLPSSYKSALVPYWARIPQRTGYRGEMRYGLLNDIRRLDRQRLTMTVQRFVALGLPLEQQHAVPNFKSPQLTVEPAQVAETRQRLRLTTTTGRLLVLCPGAEFGPAKRWPVEHFATLAQHYASQGWSVWLLGSKHDQPLTAAIVRQVPEACIDLAGQTSLADAINLLASADTVVSNDSGLMHVATALGRHVVALYGSSSPDITPPLGDNATALHLGLECSPCFKRECPLGHLRCLRELTPSQAMVAIDRT
ncbi:MAG: lipopolysaccharide heptosyltransferase II [Gammaproteobacteria bacterium]|nr:lipopolysaccharide heptosyltransferase II [Gammaproteobacteria bacterium]MDH3465328.1 lipopolysaccharide heptosyltransferase II [Gammaproteobacteria bacterium]